MINSHARAWELEKRLPFINLRGKPRPLGRGD